MPWWYTNSDNWSYSTMHRIRSWKTIEFCTRGLSHFSLVRRMFIVLSRSTILYRNLNVYFHVYNVRNLNLVWFAHIRMIYWAYRSILVYQKRQFQFIDVLMLKFHEKNVPYNFSSFLFILDSHKLGANSRLCVIPTNTTMHSFFNHFYSRLSRPPSSSSSFSVFINAEKWKIRQN